MEEVPNLANEAMNQAAGIFGALSAWAMTQVKWWQEQTTAVKVVSCAVVGVIVFALLAWIF